MHDAASTPEVSRILPGLFPSSPLVDGARRIVERLRSDGHEAYFVGGCVRNALLGEPIDDVDVATSALPAQVNRLYPDARYVGAHFGVLRVRVEEHEYEVATFRAEGGYTDHRHPTHVRFGTLAEDVQRRDFTINALYYDPLDGRLIDLVGGRGDLERRWLRAVGDPRERFEEDALRVLRAVRFAARFGLTIEPATAAALRRAAPALVHISAERVGDELGRMLTGPRPGDAVRLMGELGVWAVLAPEIDAMRGCPQPPEFHPEGDVFTHTALVLDHLTPPAGSTDEDRLILALGALLHDVGKPPTLQHAPDRIRFPEHDRVGAAMAAVIGRRWRLPERVVEGVVELVAQHMRFLEVQRMRTATLRRFIGQERFELHLALHRADCLASHGDLSSFEFLVTERQAMIDALGAPAPPPLASGRDLIALGLEPGPRFKTLLDALRDAQLEGRIVTRDAALAWLAEQARQNDAATSNRKPQDNSDSTIAPS